VKRDFTNSIHIFSPLLPAPLLIFHYATFFNRRILLVYQHELSSFY
jgi:hypothetical protein